MFPLDCQEKGRRFEFRQVLMWFEFICVGMYYKVITFSLAEKGKENLKKKDF